MRLLWLAPIEFGKMTHQVGEIGHCRSFAKKAIPLSFQPHDVNPVNINDDFSVF